MAIPISFGKPSNTPPVFSRVAIVGLGLIGGSVALAIRRTWPEALVVGVDRKQVVEQAMVSHVIDVGAEDLGMTADADLIVLAAPISINDRILRNDLGSLVGREAVVTDVGSVKRGTVDAAAALPDRLHFIGGHPLAGAARGGLEHARLDLFVSRPWILCPGPGGSLYRVDEFVAGLGAIVQTMDAPSHDQLVAFLSDLPQLTASALMAVVGEAAGTEGLALSGRGLRDTTRLAESPVDIWKDIISSNADYIGPALDTLIRALQDLRSDLTRGDVLARVFGAAQQWKARLPKD